MCHSGKITEICIRRLPTFCGESILPFSLLKPVFSSWTDLPNVLHQLSGMCVPVSFLMKCHELPFDLQHFPTSAPKSFSFVHCNTDVSLLKSDVWLSSSEPRKCISLTPSTMILSLWAWEWCQGKQQRSYESEEVKTQTVSRAFWAGGCIQRSLLFLKRPHSSLPLKPPSASRPGSPTLLQGLREVLHGPC